MTNDGIEHHLIRGVTSQRKLFRPGDWAERLAGVVALFVGERCAGNPIARARLAMPVMEQDIKCLRISNELRRICPDGFDFVMRFASDNDLMVDICRALDDKPGRDPQPERQTRLMETLTGVRFTYACAACGYRGSVVRPDASHARKLAICARCDGQVWLSVDDATAREQASAVFSPRRHHQTQDADDAEALHCK
ncbi:DUF3579 domain-containing protein [Paraburkholderia sp. JPY432]|nr:DUF3579 domain-containing protein [Paraburkholderia youngii]